MCVSEGRQGGAGFGGEGGGEGEGEKVTVLRGRAGGSCAEGGGRRELSSF